MDLLNIQSHLQESARRAAGSFLSPLTNAIGEQRRLVDSLAVVSKVRVEECKHMMVWSKSQTEDIGDVLLKLNLLIRKISDYEIRFGTQYESFREKIKYLRTKDDSLCEMGRRQAELQQKIFEASKSRLRSAKVKLLQTELDAIQKESAPTETKLQHLKRQVIKGAYTEQLNAIIELGKKMQIIGEHGKQLLDHIDLPMSPGAISDGRKTEDILQSARLALENWDQLVMVNPESVVLHPPPARSLSDISVDNVQTLAVSEAASDSDSGSESESDSGNEEEFVQAPSSSLKSKPSIALTTEKGISMPIEHLLKKPSVKPETQVDATDETTEPAQDELVSEHEEQAEEAEESEAEERTIVPETELRQQTKEVIHPSTLQAPFGSTLAPKLTLTPSKAPVSSSGPSLPPRSSDWASEASEALAKIQIKKVEELMKEDTSASEAETMRRLEELEIKQAMELSLALAEAHATAQPETSSDLKLTAEELRFVMGDVAPKRSTKIIKRKARAPETTDGDSAAVVVRPGSRPSRRERRANSSSSEKKPEVAIDTAMSASEATATESESEEDLETPTASKPTRVVRGPQASEPDGNRLSQQGPRPWVPEEELADSAAQEVDVPEELASATDVGETMAEETTAVAAKETDASKITESMGPEPERPLESMGPEPEKPLESMGPEPEVTLESMGHDGPEEEEEDVPFVPMPQMPSLDGIRQQKIIMKQQQQQQQQQQQTAYGVSPELQFLQLQNSPQSVNQQAYGQGQGKGQSQGQGQGHGQGQMQGQYSPQTPHGSLHAASPSQTYSQIGSPVPYRPATAYVPQTPKQKNRLSGSQSPDRQSTASPGSSPQPHYQQQQQQQYQSGTYSAQYLQQHQQNEQQYIRQQRQQLQDFYYSPYEQEYQQQQYQQYQQQLREQRHHQQHQRLDSVSSVSSVGSNVGIAPLGWNLPGMAPPQITDEDRRYYTEQQQYQQQQQQQQHLDRPSSAAGSVQGDEPISSGAPSPSSSHVSLVHAPSPVMASVAPLTPQGKQPPRKTSPHTASPDDYKVEVK